MEIHSFTQREGEREREEREGNLRRPERAVYTFSRSRSSFVSRGGFFGRFFMRGKGAASVLDDLNVFITYEIEHNFLTSKKKLRTKNKSVE